MNDNNKKKMIHERIAELIEFLEPRKMDTAVQQELEGFITENPEHRRLKRSVIVEFEMDNSETFQCSLIAPNDHPNNLYFDNLVSCYVGTGLLYLSEIIDNLLKEELQAAEIDHLVDIFNLSSKLRIKTAFFELTEDDILSMLCEINNIYS